mgnify:FL=1
MIEMLTEAAKAKLFNILRLGLLEGKKVSIYVGLEND